MTEGGNRVFYDRRTGSFSPFGAASGRYVNLGSTRAFRILGAIGIIHRVSIGGERGGSFVVFRIHLVFELYGS